jgi:S-sulfo-L-cysteine synthase (3-phospho-L-serine-dependent)
VSEAPTLVVLGGGPAQRHAIDAAHALSLRTLVCDSEPGVGDVAVSSEDADGVREAAAAGAAAGLIAPGTDWPVRVAAAVARDLGLPHPVSPEVAVVATDKIAQREALDDAGVPQPAWSTNEPPAYPCVVKASDRQGQRAMSILPGSADLAEAALRAAAGSRSGRVLYEAFVPGPEVTVNGFTAEGRSIVAAVTDRIHFDDAPGVAQCHVYPPERDPAAAAEAATRAVAALGIGAGPWYVQVILGPDGPQIVEVAARLGGGHDSELVKLVTGVDLARAAVLAALGRPVTAADVTPDPGGAGVIRFLEAPPGTLARAAGPPDTCFYDAPGHVYGPIRIATDRAGYVLARGATRDAALARAAADAAAVRFEMT